MAVTPMTPRSRLGSSMPFGQMRYGGAGDYAISDGLPSIDFGFDDLRERMSIFTSRFDDFIAKGRKRVLEDRNTFHLSAVEMADTQRQRQQAILDLEVRSNQHAETVAKEAQETEELKAAIAALEKQKHEQIQRRTELGTQVQAIQAEVQVQKEAQMTYQKAINVQARQNVPELRLWERLLGLRIVSGGAGTNILRFIFSIPNERKASSEEFWFEMDFGDKRQSITRMKPDLAQHDIEALERKLADDRDIGAMLKAIRQLFEQTMDE